MAEENCLGIHHGAKEQRRVSVSALSFVSGQIRRAYQGNQKDKIGRAVPTFLVQVPVLSWLLSNIVYSI